MGDIISIAKKRQSAQDERDAIVRKRKIHAVQQIFQCARCGLKCEKCGTEIPPDPSRRNALHSLRIPYRICQSCAEEYLSYIEQLKGNPDPDCYWQNAAWLESWSAWIKYRSATDSYMQSKEFQQLLQELRQNRPD